MKQIIKIVIFIIAVSVLNLQAKEPSDIDIHGFISQGFLKSDHNNLFSLNTEDGTFQFNEMGINFRSHIADGLQLGMQFIALDLGSYGNDEVTIDWAYADYFYRKWLGLRIGSLKVYHGLYNDSRDLEMLRVSILLPQCIYTEVFRDISGGMKGAGVYGELQGGFSYQVSIGGLDDIKKDSGFSDIFNYFFQIEADSYSNDNFSNVSLIWDTPLEGLRVGGTFIEVDFKGIGADTIVGDSFGEQYINFAKMEFNNFSLSFEYIHGGFTLNGEYAEQKLSYDIESAAAQFYYLINPGFNNLAMSGILTIGGYYVGMAYCLTDWFETGAYYSMLYYDLDDKKDAQWRNYYPLGHGSYLEQSTLSLKFNINTNWVLKLEGHSMRGSYLTGLDENADKKSHWFLYAAKCSFHF